MMFVASLLIGLPQRLSELARNSFNVFSVILGLNCSGLVQLFGRILSTKPSSGWSLLAMHPQPLPAPHSQLQSPRTATRHWSAPFFQRMSILFDA